MSTKTSLIINAKDSTGKAQQKTITYVNSNLSNADMKTFAENICNISSDTYQSATRIDKTELDESDEDSDGGLIPPDSDSDSDSVVPSDADSDSDSGSDSDDTPAKTEPTLTLTNARFFQAGEHEDAPFWEVMGTYSGDGKISVSLSEEYAETLTVENLSRDNIDFFIKPTEEIFDDFNEDTDFAGTISASEGNTSLAKSIEFNKDQIIELPAPD